MAQQIGGSGKFQQRNTKPRRRSFLAEATAGAEAVGEILVGRYGSQPWILQAMDAVQNAIQNAVENLSKTSIGANNHPISEPGDYRFNARTREELIASQQLAAESRGVDPRSQFRQLRDPAKTALGAPDPDDVPEEPAPMSQSGLRLPGARQQPKMRQPAQPPPAPPPTDDGPTEWAL